MKYVSIDVETTGLDSERDQIIEFAAVIDDLEAGYKGSLFHCYVVYPRIEGNAFAINMNAKAIERIAKKEPGYIYLEPTSIVPMLAKFLLAHGFDLSEKIVVAGKNYSGFDRLFLEKLSGWGHIIKPHHRTIDVGVLFMKPDDKVPPDLKECKIRAGIGGDVKHEAAADAIDVINLLRYHYGLDRVGGNAADGADQG